MAQDQRVEFLFAAQVSGQNQIDKLISAVDKLRQETEQLKSANAGLAQSTDAVIRNGKRYNNALDAQAKAVRNARQGTQQLGMQVNDFFTSVSTGASPVQAFNQQIGQVGYALSMMDGKLGAVGRLIAGPFGIALIGASMLFGQFSKGAEDASDSAVGFGDYAIAAIQSVGAEIADGLKPAIEAVGPTVVKMGGYVSTFFKNLLDLTKQFANLLIGSFVAAVNTVAILASNSMGMVAELAVNLLNGGIMSINKIISDVEAAINLMSGYMNQFLGFLGVSFRFGEARFARLEMVTNKWAGTTKKAFSDVGAAITSAMGTPGNVREYIKFDDISARAEQIAAGRGKKKEKSGGSDADRAKEKKDQEERNKALEEFNKIVERLIQKSLPEYEVQLRNVNAAFAALTSPEQIANAERLNQALDAIDAARIAEDFGKLNLQNGVLPQLADTLGKVTPLQDAIVTRNEELQSSFEAVGNTVSEAFKGMLTGAMSWKEGVKSLIASVINELWRLFVVQQIVGFVQKAMGSITGTPIPGKAIGGTVAKNQPYIVGERGPELFIPGGSGTIIPNRNLGGGKSGNSFNINVDARGSADPAAVRAQVQQGILEAAPAIIAAAEARTVGGLRRPRLGGVIQ